jgi:outer membrane receptor protein involved in Fe transport
MRVLHCRLIPGWLLALLWLTVSTAGAAQVQLSRVDGHVVDAAGQPVAGASVTVTDALGATIRRATTDASGRFVFTDLAPARYTVSVALTGGRAAPAPVPLTVADGLPLSMTLKLPPAFAEAVVVEGARPPASIATRTSIGAESIARAPSRSRIRRLQAAVATMPGWASEDNGLLHSRGVDDGFLYVVDGVPVYERIDQASSLGPDAATLDALTVVTGYVPPEFGLKSGGIVDVRTRAATGSWRGLAAIGAGSEDALDGEASAGGGLGRDVTVWLHGGGARSSRYLDPVHPDNFHNRGVAATTAGQLNAGTGEHDRIVASWSGGGARFGVPNTDEQDAAGQDQRQRLSQGAVTASWQRNWSAHTVSLVAGYVRHGSLTLDPSAFDTPITTEAERTLDRAGALAGVTHHAGRHVLKAGAEVQQLRITERFGFAVTDPDEAEEAGLSEAALAFDVDSPFAFAGRTSPWLFSAYAQDTWQAAPTLTIAAGVRFDRTRQLLPRHQWSPRLGIAYAVTETTTLRGSLSRFYQPPQPEFLLLASSDEARVLSPFEQGGAAIEPERQWAVEAGVEHRFAHGVRIDLAYWDRDVEQFADPNVFFGSTIVFPNAVASGHARGVDARLEVAPGRTWSAYGNLAIGKVLQTGPITGGLFLEDDVANLGPGVEFTPDHDQRVVASAGLTWTGARGATISGVWRFESGTPIELDEDEQDELAGRPGADLVDFDRGRVRPRNTVALNAGFTAWEAARAAIRIEATVLNLFGARYAYNFGNPFSGTHFGAPRTATVGVRVETR